MFEKITPEEAGIKTENIKKCIEIMEENGIVLHSFLLMKGDKLVTECYWKPFDREFCHRMYSQTKSYVGIAVGLLQDEGKLDINDPILKYFPEKIKREPEKYLKEQTIKDMLTMETSAEPPYWFDTEEPDRTYEYINASRISHPSGTGWSYDSAGSQVLASLVEKVSGMTLLEYLNEKLFKYMGTFKTAQILKTPNGDSWGDSALICRPRDMVSFARLLMQKGKWEGKQLISEKYVTTATSKVVDNNTDGIKSFDNSGYGYQIWRHDMDGFFFNGMGAQLTFAFPKQDLIFACTADTQGYPSSKGIIYIPVKELIVKSMQDTPLPENKKANEEFEKFAENLKLFSVKGMEKNDFEKEINGKTYICNKNRTGITQFRFDFDDKNGGKFIYTNGQGEKVLEFKKNENEFTTFPQLGYSDDYGGVRTTNGFKYKCAVSAAWTEEKKLAVRVQVIDRYFGNISMVFAFKNDEAYVTMVKTAEDFFKEYEGKFVAKRA